MIFRRYEYGDESGIDSIESTLTSHPDYQDNWDKLVFSAWTWTGIINEGPNLNLSNGHGEEKEGRWRGVRGGDGHKVSIDNEIGRCKNLQNSQNSCPRAEKQRRNSGETYCWIAGVGGIIPYEGRAFAWMVLDKRAEKREIVRALKMSIPLAQSFGFALWTYVRDGFEAGHRFARRFGLKKIRLDKKTRCWLYEN